MKEKILVVEDDAFAQQFYNFILQKHGYETFISDDPEKILAELQKDFPVLIIMDVNLTNSYLNGEKIDGIKFSEYIKSSDNFNSIPILVITAHSYDAEAKKILEESKADGMFPKPIYDFNKLLNKINELKRKSAA